jgi:hypothetical protein
MSIKNVYYETAHFLDHYYSYHDAFLWMLRDETSKRATAHVNGNACAIPVLLFKTRNVTVLFGKNKTK